MDNTKKDPHHDDVGSIRWASNSRLSSSTPTPPSASTPIATEKRTQSSIRIYSEFHTESPSSSYDHEPGTFAMDVNAFEKSLQEKRERQMHRPSPRIEIRLRETSTNSPEPHIHGTALSKINIHHIERGGGIEANTPEPPPSSYDEVDFISETPPRKVKRVITYEKVLKTKTVRKTSHPRPHSSSETIRSPATVHRTADYFVESSSTERIGRASSQGGGGSRGGSGRASAEPSTAGADDSAYHSHIIPRARLATSSSVGTPTAISISSSLSSNSLPYAFQSDENVYARQRTPSRERADSEPPPHVSHFAIYDETAAAGAASSSTATANRNVQSSLDSNSPTARIATVVYDDEVTAHRRHRINNPNQQWEFVSPVTGSNENVQRRHFHGTSTSSDGDGISPDWYNEYQTQTIAIECPRKMDFKRSNSQYDNHIRQIRGTRSNSIDSFIFPLIGGIIYKFKFVCE